MDAPLKAVGSVDYLSLTLREAALVETMARAGEHLLMRQSALGYETREAFMHGYALQRCGDIQVGRSPHGVWISLIGHTADLYWRRFQHYGATATRVDLALTAEFSQPLKDCALHGYNHAVSAYGEASRRKYALVQSQGGGQTLYVGSRKSSMFGRLYDRGIKAGTHGQAYLWRWEVEYKADKASTVWTALQNSSDVSTLSAGLVTSWFATREVESPSVSLVHALPLSTHTVAPTIDNRLEWMRQQVRPSVKKLMDGGHAEAVLKALGVIPEGKNSAS